MGEGDSRVEHHVGIAPSCREKDSCLSDAPLIYDRIEDLDSTLDHVMIEIAPVPRSALFLAGKAFLKHRAVSGLRAGVLPKFFIGAHAAIERWPLLTRDARRYRRYSSKGNLDLPPV